MDSSRLMTAWKITAVVAMILLLVMGLLYLVDNKFLGPFSNIVVIISALGAPYFFEKYWTKRTNLNDGKSSILVTLNGILNWRSSDDVKLNQITIEQNGKKHRLSFYLAYIGHSSFDSVISSGHFTLFPPKLQEKLNNIRLRICLNNRMMDRCQNRADFCIQNGVSAKNNPGRYYKIMLPAWLQLAKVQKEMFEEIEDVRQYL